MIRIFALLLLLLVSAATIDIPRVKAADQIELRPTKIELELAPGESQERSITVTNQTLFERSFSLQFEDFAGGLTAEEAIRFGPQSTVNSLRSFLKIQPEDQGFVLSPGEKRLVKFKVDLPNDLSGGGLYGAIIFSTQENGNSATGFATAIGTLVFVKILGPVLERGELIEFGALINKDTGKPEFDVLYENTGDIYLNPYGYISLKNWRNQEVGFLPLEPWFVMPRSLRRLEINSQLETLKPGWYRAEIKLNRGYGNIVDVMSDSFVVWPGGLLVILVLVVGLIAGLGLRTIRKR